MKLAPIALLLTIVVLAETDTQPAAERWPPTTLPAGDFPRPPGFTGSPHDFYGPSAPFEMRCAPCHASPMPTTQPWIWHWDPRTPFDQRLGSIRERRQIAPSSILCLSCHDGTIASEIVGGGSDDALFASGALVNPGRDHPIGVEYPPLARARPALRRDYVPIAKLESEGRIKLPEGRVECVSCHEPHNAYGHRGMLVKSDRRSGLCLSCHLK